MCYFYQYISWLHLQIQKIIFFNHINHHYSIQSCSVLWITCFLSFPLFLSLSLSLSLIPIDPIYSYSFTQFSSKGIYIMLRGWLKKKNKTIIWHQPIPKIIPVLSLILDHQSKHLISFWWISSLNTWVLFLLFDLSWGLSKSSKLSNIEHQK